MHREPLKHGDREEEHHDRAMHREDLIVGLGIEEGVVRHDELGAHQQGEETSDQEKDEASDEEAFAHHPVADRGQIADARRVIPNLLEPLVRRALGAAGIGLILGQIHDICFTVRHLRLAR